MPSFMRLGYASGRTIVLNATTTRLFLSTNTFPSLPDGLPTKTLPLAENAPDSSPPKLRPPRTRKAITDPSPSPPPPHLLIQSTKCISTKIDFIPLSDNATDLFEPKSFPYGLPASSMKEWARIAENVTTNADGNQGGVGITSTLLISYSKQDGELMLRQLAMGIARSTDADFVAVSVENLKSLSLELKQAYRRGVTEAACVASTTFTGASKATLLSSFFNPRLRGAKGMQDLIANSSFPIAFQYLESLTLGTTSSKRKVIYIHNEEGIFFDRDELCREYRRYLRHRKVDKEDDTGVLFIFSEGCGVHPEDRQLTITLREDISRDSEIIDSDSIEDSRNIRALPSGERLRASAFDCFSWLVDRSFAAPRIVVFPPSESQFAQAHKLQIERDSEVLTSRRNYHAILKQLKGLSSRKSGVLSVYATSLPLHLEASPQLLEAIPSLKKHILGSAEVLTLCLTLPNHVRRTSSPPEVISAFTEAVEEFCKNRAAQMISAHFADSYPSNQQGKSNHPLQKLRHEGNLTTHEERFAACVVTPGQVKTNFEDIGALDSAKRTLHELISLRFERPEYFAKGLLKGSVSGILLFGPPGTGKTMLSKAVAAKSGVNFIAVNSSTVFDKYVGEGEKNVKALFSLARKLAPCIIFVDEVDALLDSRDNSFGRPSRLEIINEFMSEWDGLLSQNDGVTVLAATNRPYVLDDAVLRRLPRRILIDLPDKNARQLILQILLREEKLSSDLDMPKLAKHCENYSGSDLKNLCVAAAMRALQRHRDDPEHEMEIGMSDFENAFNDVPASISEKMGTLHELRQWNRRFGAGEHTHLSDRDRSLGF